MPLEVYADHRVPLFFAHVREHAVTQEAGVVDQYVEPAEVVERRLDEILRAGPVGHVVAVDDGLATERTDFLDDLLRG